MKKGKYLDGVQIFNQLLMHSHFLKKFLTETLHISGCWLFLKKWNNEIAVNFKTLWPLLWMGFNCLKATVTLRRQFTFYHSVPRHSWYSFYWPPKDERLSQPWSYSMVLNTGLLDWESSALTTSPHIILTLAMEVYPSTNLRKNFVPAKFWQIFKLSPPLPH